MDKLQLITQAKSVLSISISVKDFRSSEELLKLSKQLAKHDLFYYAREVLYRLAVNRHYQYVFTLKDKQNLAKYIYKDPNLFADTKFEKALSLLESHRDIDSIQDCESCGLIGAIYKRKWYYDRDIINLEKSKAFYKKGYDYWVEYNENIDDKNYNSPLNDDGYCAINYAFVCDLIALQKLRKYEGVHNKENIEDINKFQNEAYKTRIYIIDSLTEDNKLSSSEKVNKGNFQFIYATIIEALLGAKNYTKASKFVGHYNELAAHNNWEKHTTLEQLQMLYQIQFNLHKLIACEEETSCPFFNETAFKKVMGSLFYENPDQIIPNTMGKVGIALSGGGFRASYFHIGVLAALAENDKLKDIEVISCVSGGSILGAHYYLLLRELLENNNDDSIQKENYVELVVKLINDFHYGVKKNLRLKWIFNLPKSILVPFIKNYNRTIIMGDMYDKYFYKNVTKTNKIALRDIRIEPNKDLSNQTKFNIKSDNFYRINKVPQIVINSTSLNSGHNFQFTASWLGEPPFLINPDVNVKARLRRVYFDSITDKKLKNYPLSNAVAASACVPVIFKPVNIKGLYKDIDLKLVDGGVHDNQGLAALIENECKQIIVSDASGQLRIENYIKENPINDFYRNYNVSAEHIRELQLNRILKDSKNNFFDNLQLVHLKKDLKEADIPTYFNEEAEGLLFNHNNNATHTTYGIKLDVQRTISNIRTDLDEFTDTEANALMFSAYKQTISSLKLSYEKVVEDYPWIFKEISNRLENDSTYLIKELEISNKTFFKMLVPIKLKFPKLYKISVLSICLVAFYILFMLFKHFFLNNSLINKLVLFLEILFNINPC